MIDVDKLLLILIDSSLEMIKISTMQLHTIQKGPLTLLSRFYHDQKPHRIQLVQAC